MIVQSSIPWSESDTKLLIGYLMLYQDISLSELRNFFPMNTEELRSIVEMLQEKQVFEVEFFGDNVVFLYHNLTFHPDLDKLTPEEIKLLGFLKGVEAVTFRDISHLMNLPELKVKETLANLISRGFIRDLTYRGNDFKAELPDEIFSNLFPLTEFHKDIIGYLLIRVNVSLVEVADELQEPYEKVITELMKLVLSGKISVIFRLEWRLWVLSDVFVELVHYSPPDNPRDVALLSTRERLVLGYVAITENPNVDRITQLFLFDRKTIIRVISRLTYEGNFVMFLTHNGHIVVSKQFSFTPLGSIQSLSTTSIFDYHALVGYIEKKKSVRLKTIAEKFQTSVRDIYKRIIDLYFTREIVGKIKGDTAYLSRAKSSQSRGVISPLSITDRILLGALIARKKLTWIDISSLLSLHRDIAIQKSYSLLAKSNTIVYIRKNRELRIKNLLHLPPLIQIQGLSDTRKIVLGYCRNNKTVKCGKLAKIISRSKLDTLKIIYYLIGSGLIEAKGKSMKLKILSVTSETPLLGINELKGNLGLVGRRLRSLKGRVSYKQLTSELGIRKLELLRNLYILSAEGYLTFKQGWWGIRKINFIKKQIQTPLCLNCGEEIEDLMYPCPNCLVRLPRCVICRKGLTKMDSISSCPSCAQKGHTKHFKQWLKIRAECPQCRISLSPSELLVERKNDL